MKQSKTSQYAYTAGLIDGEGCIQIRKILNKSKSYYTYSLTVLANMCDGEALQFLIGCFGGNIYQAKYENMDKSKLPVYRWEVRGEKAFEFLKKIYPFLRIKKLQAELAMRFAIRQISKTYTDRYGLKEHDLKFFEECYNRMRELKKIHNAPNCAVVETKYEDSLPLLEVIGQREAIVQALSN